MPMRGTIVAGAFCLMLVACAPTVSVQGGDKPIVIDLNIKIQQEVRVKVDKDLDNLVKSDPSLF
jgi:hypothetical protein